MTGSELERLVAADPCGGLSLPIGKPGLVEDLTGAELDAICVDCLRSHRFAALQVIFSEFWSRHRNGKPADHPEDVWRSVVERLAADSPDIVDCYYRYYWSGYELEELADRLNYLLWQQNDDEMREYVDYVRRLVLPPHKLAARLDELEEAAARKRSPSAAEHVASMRRDFERFLLP